MNQNTESVSNLDTEPTSSGASTTRKVAGAAHKAIDEGATRAENLERQIRDRASRAQDKASESRRAASERMERSLGEVELFVRERPLAATGIAFAAGVLFAAILRK